MTKELTTDVLVIGAGGAGLAAALSANEHGAKVLVAEKMPEIGGSAIKSGAGVGATGTKAQKARGIEDKNENWLEEWHEREDKDDHSNQYPDYDFVDYFMTEAVKTTNWMTDYVGQEWKMIAGFGVNPFPRLHFVRSDYSLGGPDLVATMKRKLDEVGVEILLNTPAQKLEVESGRVVGAWFKQDGEDLLIHAKDVIIAAGGFGHNPDLLKKYVPVMADYTDRTYTGEGNTGDGIKMAVEAGGQLYEDPWVLGNGIGAKVKGTYMLAFDRAKMYVNAKGNRFMNESIHYSQVTNRVLAEGKSWIVVDSRKENEEFDKNLKTGEAYGEVVEAPTLTELAEKMGVPAGNLEKAVSDYNRAAETGNDVMGKEQDMIVPITEAPFYAVKIYPTLMGTIGGVKINRQFQVLDKDGEPIPGLFATGECANQPIYNDAYVSGSSVQYALTSGRIAGEVAVSQD